MPSPVPSWITQTPLTVKSLVQALYTSDGSGDHPNGIGFHSQRPILAEVYTRTPTLATSSGGVQTALSTSGTTTGGLIVYDTAGLFGMTQDQPFAGYYQFLASIKGSAGDGATAGGWTILSHFAAIAHGATQTSVSADLLGTAQPSVSGTRQAPSSGQDSTAFFLDLVNTPGGSTGITWQPAVTIRDSGSANATTVVTTDGSGETCRLCAIWAAVSASVNGLAVFNIAGTYPFTGPAGVFSVTVAAIGAGGGGGAGNNSVGGTQFGGGGAAGGGFSQGNVGITPFNNYTVIVPAGGTGGTAPGSPAGTPGPGSAGANAVFAGDSSNVTAPGGPGGGGATGTANGTGGPPGGGGTGTTQFAAGSGANGKTAIYGGGGGSSAGTSAAGTNATSAAGALAPVGGGPGGQGGTSTISIVQTASGKATGTNQLAVKMPSAIQAGNTVLCFTYYQGSAPTSEPTAALNDGTAFTPAGVIADMTSLGVPLQVGLLNAFAVPGGETTVNVTGHGGRSSVQVLIAEVYEVAGLGPSPNVDVSASHTQGGAHPDNFYTSNAAATTQAPELWVGWVGGQYPAPFSVSSPSASGGWTTTGKLYANNGGYYAGCQAAWQTVTKTGTMLYNGTFSRGVSKGALAAAYSTSAATVGAAPVTGPGGGGGAGLGDTNNGGAGHDGQVTLTWAGISGSGYGNPQLPAPYSNWGDLTTAGTGANATVNLNSPAGIRDVLNYLSNPPVFRISTVSGQSIPAATLTGVTFSGSTPTVDSYTGWNSGTGLYTVQRSGLYLFGGLGCFASGTAANQVAGATINGTTYWGPPSPSPSAGTANLPKTQVFSLQAGDTVGLSVYQGRGTPQALATTDATRFFLVWLGEAGLNGTWFPPDVTFRWQAGTRPTSQGGNLSALLQQHLGNDLSFLAYRPYLMAYQSTAQTGLTQSAFSAVTLDKVQGIVHITDPGDSYSGWVAGASNAYTAPVAGTYLVAGEFFATNPASAGPTVVAGIQPSTSGGVTPAHPVDYFQQNQATTSATLGGGATVFGLYCLQAGESITPVINGNGYSAAYGTTAGVQAGGTIKSHLSVVWLSE